MKSPAGMTRMEVIGSIVVVLLVGAVVSAGLFPAATSDLRPARKARAKNDVTQIATAVMAYNTEYGHLPSMPTNGLVGGDLLSALVGSNQALNPRNIQSSRSIPWKRAKAACVTASLLTLEAALTT